MNTDPRRGLQRSEHRLLLLGGDVAAACVAVVASLWIWSLTTGFAFDAAFVWKWAVFAVLAPVWVLLLAPARQLRVGLSLNLTWRTLLVAAASVAAAYLLAYFYAPRAVLPRLPALYFLWEAALLTLGWRLCYLYALSRGLFRRRALVIASAPAAASFAELLRGHAPDVEIVGSIDPGATEDALDELVRTRGVAEIVIGPRAALAPALLPALLRWQERGIEVVPMTTEYEHVLMRVPIADLEPDWMFTSLPEWVRARDASRAAKRIIDILCGLAGLMVLVVAAPIAALLIVADSGRPVFYRQRRLGAGGRTFDVLKFRTMVQGAETEGPQWATKSDPRVTRVGRWLRRSRVDELPQVFSVLRGDMSTVGPRPERPEFAEVLERQIPFYRTRLMVRPGLTGWAQVNTPYGDSVEGAALKLEYDLYYIKHRSLLFDLWIVLRTVGTVFAMGGR
ncbi:MAG: exopolysaccharide biosynthesis polyprenyl glycosylphosphotransferase [Acidobacteria bacterium]|nr:exopolysaccharide biosynthesis polyprenyl glycosylphosphotransferase [Acidobacteriota bacterium]